MFPTPFLFVAGGKIFLEDGKMHSAVCMRKMVETYLFHQHRSSLLASFETLSSAFEDASSFSVFASEVSKGKDGLGSSEKSGHAVVSA